MSYFSESSEYTSQSFTYSFVYW